jgi:hypothetical protein
VAGWRPFRDCAQTVGGAPLPRHPQPEAFPPSSVRPAGGGLVPLARSSTGVVVDRAALAKPRERLWGLGRSPKKTNLGPSAAPRSGAGQHRWPNFWRTVLARSLSGLVSCDGSAAAEHSSHLSPSAFVRRPRESEPQRRRGRGGQNRGVERATKRHPSASSASLRLSDRACDEWSAAALPLEPNWIRAARCTSPRRTTERSEVNANPSRRRTVGAFAAGKSPMDS